MLAESRLPKHLLYVSGWPTVMPSWDEALLIAEVRVAVASALGLKVDFTDPESILGRYAELMAAKEEKLALAA